MATYWSSEFSIIVLKSICTAVPDNISKQVDLICGEEMEESVEFLAVFGSIPASAAALSNAAFNLAPNARDEAVVVVESDMWEEVEREEDESGLGMMRRGEGTSVFWNLFT